VHIPPRIRKCRRPLPWEMADVTAREFIIIFNRSKVVGE